MLVHDVSIEGSRQQFILSQSKLLGEGAQAAPRSMIEQWLSLDRGRLMGKGRGVNLIRLKIERIRGAR